MCKAFVQRFCCGHGILMGFEKCKIGPCPILKTSGDKLPQQPWRCYNCQHRKQTKTSRPTHSRVSSCAPLASIEELEGPDASEFLSSKGVPRTSSFPLSAPSVYHPLPGVARQPKGSVAFGDWDAPVSKRQFKFQCQSSSHHLTPHYLGLPSHLSHQDHDCPPCQLNCYRDSGDYEAILKARSEHPRLSHEELIRAGSIREWQEKPSLEQYIDEKRTEERELWFNVTRKWTQDLRRARVLVAEEDGLGLLG